MTLRALVVGCGKIAGGYNRGRDDTVIATHALAYVRHGGFALAGCVDPDRCAREQFQAKWEVPTAFPSLSAALKSEKFDVVSICTPTGSHIQTATEALANGVKRIFAEKPLDGNAERIRRLSQEASTAGAAVLVNFTRRFDLEMRRLRREVAEGAYGELRFVVGWYCRGIVNNGSHLIDLVTFLIGRPRIVDVDRAIDDGVPNDLTLDARLVVGHAPLTLIGCDGRDYSRFEVELSFSGAVITLERGGLIIRRRERENSRAFEGVRVLEEGCVARTGYEMAMLTALDELVSEPPAPLSSTLEDAAGTIELVSELAARGRCLSAGSKARTAVGSS